MGNHSNQNKNVEMDFPAPELLTGQTTIGQDGKLHKASHTPAPVGASKACSSCVRSVGDKETCRLCEQYSCSHCSKSCCCCLAVVCAFCTIIVENEVGEQVYCTSCSVFEI